MSWAEQCLILRMAALHSEVPVLVPPAFDANAAHGKVQGAEADAVSIALSCLHSPRRTASEAAHMFLSSCLQNTHQVTFNALAYLLY